MEYSFDAVISYAREFNIATNHDWEAEHLLSSLSRILPGLIRESSLEAFDKWPKDEPARIPREVARYLAKLCSPTTVRHPFQQANSRGLEQVELPLLTTDHENDVLKFRKRMKTTQERYIERPNRVDFETSASMLEDVEQISAQGAQFVNKLNAFSSRIPSSARDLLQEILGSKLPQPLGYNGNLDQTKISEPPLLSSPLLSAEHHYLPPIEALQDLTNSEVVNVSHPDGLSPRPLAFNEDLIMPHQSNVDAINTKTLDHAFLRMSMTPECEVSKVTINRNFKMASPLTPPNTIRTYRQSKATDPAIILKEMHLDMLQQGTNIASSPYARRDKAAFDIAHRNIQKIITEEHVQPRMLVKKLHTFQLPSTWPLSTQPMAWTPALCTTFRLNIWKNLSSSKAQEADIRSVAWSPSSPHAWNVEEFRSRFDLGTLNSPGRSKITRSPIDPRTLIYFGDDNDNDRHESLDPGLFPNPKDISLLVRKRKFDLLTLGAVDVDDYQSKSRSTVAPRTLDNDLSSLNFHLMASRKKIFDLSGDSSGATVSKGRFPVPSQIHRIAPSIPVPKLAPCPDTAKGDLQMIARSGNTIVQPIIRTVRNLVKNITIIERDFIPNSSANSNIPADADFLLSPKAGVIISSITEIQQTSLSGEKTETKIRARIIALAPKLEKLFILVKANTDIDHDLLAFNRFIKQQGQLSGTKIEVVSCKEQPEIAQQVFKLSVFHNVSSKIAQLLDEETRSELWLRTHAGMNAFAAQAILHCVRRLENNEMGSTLSLLRRMGDDQRIELLVPVVGRKNVENLNRAMLRTEDCVMDLDLKAREMYH